MLPVALTWTCHRAEIMPIEGWYSPRFGCRVQATSLVGTEAEVAERVERFRGAGIDRLIVSPVHVERSEQRHTLERLASLAGVSA